MATGAPADQWTKVASSTHSRFLPSLADVFIIACCIWLVAASGQGSVEGLLQDGDTGVHIRTGLLILETGSIPHADPYSWTKPGAPWLAWEWLSDILFAVAYRIAGLTGVVSLCAGVLAATIGVMLRRVILSARNAVIAVALVSLLMSAAKLHFLARPHVFTLLFFAVSLSLIDRNPRRALWVLPLLTVLWVNLHGGVFALFITLAIIVCGTLLERRWQDAKMLAATLGLSIAASFVNPFGYHLHQHVLEYIRADWIRESVAEFRPPDLQTASGVYFEILLFTAIISVAADLRKRRFARLLVIAAWAHAALNSARHVPLFVIVAAPAIADFLAGLWRSVASSTARDSVLSVVDRLGADHAAGLTRHTIWAAIIPFLLFAMVPAVQDYPASKYPSEIVRLHGTEMKSARLFTTDEWADYVLFRLYPDTRVFLDGRSDFYGEEIVEDYKRLIGATAGWESLSEKYAFDLVMMPKSAALVSALKRDARWTVVAEKGDVSLLRRNRSARETASADTRSLR